MRVCVHKMWRSRVVYLYIGAKPSSQVRKGERAIWVVGTARYKWVGQDKQEECSRGRAVEASVQYWNEAMKEVFARCSKKMAVQVCTGLWLHNYAVKRKFHELSGAYCPWLIMIIPWFANQLCNTDRCLFLQVKNKPWLPWVYSWILHLREQHQHLPLQVGLAGRISLTCCLFAIWG